MTPLATKEYRAALVTALAELSLDVDDMAFEWGPGALAPTILALKEITQRAQRLLGLLEQRYGQERATTMYVAPDGKRYVWRTPRERDLTDPEGLKAELAKLPMDGWQRSLFDQAFKRKPAETEAHHGYLNQMADRSKEAREVIRSYRGWKYRPAHLELLDEGEKRGY